MKNNIWQEWNETEHKDISCWVKMHMIFEKGVRRSKRRSKGKSKGRRKGRRRNRKNRGGRDTFSINLWGRLMR